MTIFKILEFAAWAASAVLAVWLLIDLIRTNRAFSEAVLMSSREGEIEDELVVGRSTEVAYGGKA